MEGRREIKHTGEGGRGWETSGKEEIIQKSIRTGNQPRGLSNRVHY